MGVTLATVQNPTLRPAGERGGVVDDPVGAAVGTDGGLVTGSPVLGLNGVGAASYPAAPSGTRAKSHYFAKARNVS